MTRDYDPQTEYRQRLAARQREVARHDARYRRVAWARLADALLLALVVWLVFWPALLTPWWLLAPPAFFVALMAVHSRIDRDRRRAVAATQFYERGLARLEDRWIGTGEPGDRFSDPDHLYSADLDIFGSGSVFELLSICRTKAGEEILANWLRQPATCEEAVSRQEAVEELRHRLDLREALATIGPDLRSSIHLDRLRSWATAPAALTGRWLAALVSIGPVVVLGALAYSFMTGRVWAFYGCLIAQAGLVVMLRRQSRAILDAAELGQKELDLVSELIARVEEESFSGSRLAGLRSRFDGGEDRVSSEIRHLVRLIDRRRSLKSADGPITLLLLFLTLMLIPFSIVVLLDPKTAMAVERWRGTHGPNVEGWILAIGELEALMSLAGYAWEHPADPFPDVVPDGPVLIGDALSHPLLPRSVAVPNSLRLDAEQQLIVVSGSNMSGKSTLLRTLGVNTVLALAGAPVRARSLRVSPLAIGATLRIQDSLQAGTSRFYAEITRIRDIMALAAGPRPVLFLLDEVLHGTNSHDRAIGAEGIVRGLIQRRAVGLATTHDLALARVADSLDARAINVHFEDRMEGGRMVFDYTMKPGVIQKSNALNLMRAVGLEIPED